MPSPAEDLPPFLASSLISFPLAIFKFQSISKLQTLGAMSTLQSCVCFASQENRMCGKPAAPAVYSHLCSGDSPLPPVQTTGPGYLSDTGQ